MSVAEKINKEIIQPKKMGLLAENPVYKPFRYPWCYDAWLTQQRIHWLPEEVPLGDDVRDWQKNLSQPEKNLLTQIFRFLTQADVEVNNCYLRHYTTVFKPTEVLMMMTAFAANGNSSYCCLLSLVRYYWDARNRIFCFHEIQRNERQVRLHARF